MPEETNGAVEPVETDVATSESTTDVPAPEETPSPDAETDAAEAPSDSPEGSDQSKTELELKRAQERMKAEQRKSAELQKKVEELSVKEQADVKAAEEGKLNPQDLTPEAQQFLELAEQRAVDKMEAKLSAQKKEEQFKQVVDKSINEGKEEWKNLFGKEMTDDEIREMQDWATERGGNVFQGTLADSIKLKHMDQYVKKGQAELLKGKVSDEAQAVEKGGKGVGHSPEAKKTPIPKTRAEETRMILEAM